MKQILQSCGSGATVLEQVPVARPSGNTLVVGTRLLVVSARRERSLAELGHERLIQRARRQPDGVRRVPDKIFTDRQAPPPIPAAEVLEVGRWAIRMGRRASAGRLSSG